MLHVIPVNDERAHELTGRCWCEPEIQWADPEDGLIYPNPAAPMVIHRSADCREVVELLLDESVAADKGWEVIED